MRQRFGTAAESWTAGSTGLLREPGPICCAWRPASRTRRRCSRFSGGASGGYGGEAPRRPYSRSCSGASLRGRAVPLGIAARGDRRAGQGHRRRSIVLTFRLRLNERDLLFDTLPKPAGRTARVRVVSVERLQRGRRPRFRWPGGDGVLPDGYRDRPGVRLPWVGRQGSPGHVKTAPLGRGRAGAPAGNRRCVTSGARALGGPAARAGRLGSRGRGRLPACCFADGPATVPGAAAVPAPEPMPSAAPTKQALGG